MGKESMKNRLDTEAFSADTLSLSSLRRNARVIALMAFISAMAACAESDMTHFEEAENSETAEKTLSLRSYSFHSNGVIAFFEPIGKPIDVDVLVDGENIGTYTVDSDGSFILDFGSECENCDERDGITNITLVTPGGNLIGMTQTSPDTSLINRPTISGS